MTLTGFAQTIARHHAGLQVGQAPAWNACALAADAALPLATQSVLKAARRLGFIEADAQTIARAWAAQTARTGAFDPLAWPCEPVDFGLPAPPAANALDAPDAPDACATCPQALGLYAVLPDAAWVARMANAGLPTLQLRFKSADTAAVRREMAAAARAVQGTAARLFINDHWQLALEYAHQQGTEAGLYGIHLGQQDMDAADLVAIRASGLRLGLSTHGYAEIARAAAWRPSYLALGAVFPTTLKRMDTAPQGTGRLSAYARLLRHWPLVAIGGIDAATMPAIMASGVGSVAVVRAITAAPNPEAAARRLMAAMQQPG